MATLTQKMYHKIKKKERKRPDPTQPHKELVLEGIDWAVSESHMRGQKLGPIQKRGHSITQHTPHVSRLIPDARLQFSFTWVQL